MQSKYVWLCLLFAVNLFGVEGKLRVYVQPHESLYTSQKLTVAVELLTDAFSITDAKITFLSSLKYMVNTPKSAAYIQQEEIDGTDWQSVHYEYEVYALQAGEIKIAPVSATFSASMGYGQPKKAFDLKSEALHFSVLSPKGIKKDQFVLVTDSYSLSQKVNPQKSELIVGDAIEIELTQKAHAVPDILLKPIHYKSTALLRVYEKEPLLQSDLKGKFDVTRTDKFTFVATAEGNVTVPEQKMVWWDSKSEKVIVETIPALHFSIIADPQIALDMKTAKEKKMMLIVGVILFFFFLVYRLCSPAIYRYRVKKKEAYLSSEEGKFDLLLQHLKKDEVSSIYQALYVWISMFSPKLSNGGFAALIEIQPSLQKPLREFEETMLDPQQRFDTIALRKELHILRELLLRKKEKHKYALQENINPQ